MADVSTAKATIQFSSSAFKCSNATCLEIGVPVFTTEVKVHRLITAKALALSLLRWLWRPRSGRYREMMVRCLCISVPFCVADSARLLVDGVHSKTGAFRSETRQRSQGRVMPAM